MTQLNTPLHASATRWKHHKGDRDYIADFTDILDGATLSSVSGSDPNGVALGATVAPAGLTVENVQINTGSNTTDGHTTPANQGCEFSARGGVAGRLYEVTILARTSDGATVGLICPIQC